jgi:hypothetical protein
METQFEQTVKVRKYRELNEPPLESFEGLNLIGTTQVYSKSGYFMHPDSEGTDVGVYHHSNGLTIAVNQSNVDKTILMDKNAGLRGRNFIFGGEISKIEEIVKELEQNGVKLEIIK